MKKMTSIKVENNEDDLGFTNSYLNTKETNSLHFSHCSSKNGAYLKNVSKNSENKKTVACNRENKCVSENIKPENNLGKNQISLHNVNNTELVSNSKNLPSENEKKYLLNNTSTLKNKITPTLCNTSDKGIKTTVNKDVIKTEDNLIDNLNIYISCRFCKKGFETAESFSNHDCKKKKNSKIKMHKCKFCSLTFAVSHLTTHIKGHAKNNCTLCNAQFTKRKSLCKHLRTVHNVKEPERLYQCSFCDKHFSKKLALNIHLKTHINNEYFCLKCCFMCDDENTYNDHVKQHEKISKHECHLCEKKFVRRQQYDQHMMAHERDLCSSCNMTFSSKKLFLKHQHSVHRIQNVKKHACLTCKKVFDRPKYLEIHQRVHTGERPVKCSHCDTHFYDSKNLLKHMKTVKHLQRVSNQKGQITEIEKTFLCSKCGVMFYHQQSLLRHVEIIHSTTEFLNCPHCDYKSKCKTNYKRHLELHTDVKRFVCELCGSSFRALATLKEHYTFVHSEDREFICDICKKGFKNKSTLLRHMRIHSENRPYKCYCNKAYKRMSHLKRHMISAHQMTLKRNQMPILMKENTDLNTSMSDENVAALIKTLEALPDDSSCDDFLVPHCTTTVFSNEPTEQDDIPVSQSTTTTPINHAEALIDLNGNSGTEQLQTETRDDAVPSKSVQELLDSCVYNIAGDSVNPLNTFDLTRHLNITQDSVLPNTETSSTSLDDATLSLSPSNYCNTSSPLNIEIMSIENVTTLSHSIAPQEVNELTSLDDMIHSQSSANLNFHAPPLNIDNFVSFSNSDTTSSLSIPPFSLNSSPSHVADLNLDQNPSQRQLFGATDFLSLPSYESNNEFEVNCSAEQFFNWDTDENSNNLKVSISDLATPNTCANIFSSSLPCNVNNIFPNNLFANDSIEAATLKSELESLSNL